MFQNDPLLLIADLPGYSPDISRLLSMMNYARFTTLQEVKGLTMEQLDFVAEKGGNSIGALLLHAAAVEYAYQASTFEERELNQDELRKWGPALNLGDEGRAAIRGHDLDYYIERLNEVRNRTFDLFRSVTDEWLYIEQPFWYNKQANYYFKWFHVFEDEINHRGQIRLIRKKLST
ncbi:DinB family protein [Paenibacillus sp. AK002]